MNAVLPIRELLTQHGLALTPAEAKIAQVLLGDYPVAGLGTATALARRAGVSDPSVIRMVTKLGFDGFAGFQKRLLEEVEAGLRSPLMMMEAKRPVRATGGRSVEETYIRSAAAAVESAGAMTLPQTYGRAVQLIMEAKGRVLLLGGRFSRHIAGMLAGYLGQFRAGVIEVPALSAESFDLLLDAGPRDAVVVFDHRRYQTDVIRFAEQAAERGAQIVLFTDVWRSPAAEHAKVVIVGPMEAESPYDTLAPAVAQMEALVARIVAEYPDGGGTRMEELERIRSRNVATVDGTKAPTKRAIKKKR
ncbi:MurR/RpiR family transcriptional regulator [Steroidobacter sp.]|uniref:MurR/RpiR family transcriptional regulator n=1 Tax=Steroidobacter sp. TaxID=1978227 RepID=UPI001A5A5A21|nr:MurR/RpiR family transcriptional regulator [Steroidobacter sp.]MBL8267016.1 MurR/RpiR family transcriptional regulator [Steroidobacter sp.]